MINPLQKYQKLLEALAPDAHPNHSHHNAYFYFRNLRILDAELLLGEIEISEARRQVKALQDRLGIIGQEERRKEGAQMQEELENQRNGDSSSSFLQPAVFTCPQPGCSKAFERESGLQLHALLVHSTRAARPKYQSTFKMELKSSEHLA